MRTLFDVALAAGFFVLMFVISPWFVIWAGVGLAALYLVWK